MLDIYSGVRQKRVNQPLQFGLLDPRTEMWENIWLQHKRETIRDGRNDIAVFEIDRSLLWRGVHVIRFQHRRSLNIKPSVLVDGSKKGEYQKDSMTDFYLSYAAIFFFPSASPPSPHR